MSSDRAASVSQWAQIESLNQLFQRSERWMKAVECLWMLLYIWPLLQSQKSEKSRRKGKARSVTCRFLEKSKQVGGTIVCYDIFISMFNQKVDHIVNPVFRFEFLASFKICGIETFFEHGGSLRLSSFLRRLSRFTVKVLVTWNVDPVPWSFLQSFRFFRRRRSITGVSFVAHDVRPQCNFSNHVPTHDSYDPFRPCLGDGFLVVRQSYSILSAFHRAKPCAFLPRANSSRDLAEKLSVRTHKAWKNMFWVWCAIIITLLCHTHIIVWLLLPCSIV